VHARCEPICPELHSLSVSGSDSDVPRRAYSSFGPVSFALRQASALSPSTTARLDAARAPLVAYERVDAIDLFLSRYGDLHQGLVEGLLTGLPEGQLRARPHPGVNTIVWLLWHSARIEDLAVNRFLADSPQVLDEWRDRLGVPRRDVGTGMSDAEVDELSARIDLAALRGYWDAVTARTLSLTGSLRGPDLAAVVPAARVKSVVQAESAVAPGVEWLTEFWAGGRTRAWMLAQTALLHPYGHYYEARVTAGLWGARSP
jgi:hypothetical protein